MTAYPLLIEKDVDVPMRDGARLKADVFRPGRRRRVPGHPQSRALPEGQALGSAADTLEEKPQPVDELGDRQPANGGCRAAMPRCGSTGAAAASRPASASRGRSRKSIDFYDAIEWAAAQPWCNGNVGLSGISYFAINQWFVANHQPPSLKAIIPWEGFADLYRDALFHGGILSVFMTNWFTAHLMHHLLGRASQHHAECLAGQHAAFLAAQQSRQRRASAARRRSGTRSRCRCSRSATGPAWRCICAATPKRSCARPRKHKKLRIQAGTHVHPFYTEEGRTISCASSTTGSRASTTA